MDKVAELQGIANEEDGRVIAGHVPVAFFGVELEGKAAGVALGVGGTFFAADSGEADEGGSFLADRVEEFRGSVLGHVGVAADEIAMGAGALGVDDALGNTLAIKVGHFFEEQEIFKDDRAAGAYGQGILVVAYRTACVRGHY